MKDKSIEYLENWVKSCKIELTMAQIGLRMIIAIISRCLDTSSIIKYYLTFRLL